MGRALPAHPAPAVVAEDQKHGLRLFKINREAEWEFLVLADGQEHRQENHRAAHLIYEGEL
jgi:hypothetical protein